MWSEPLEPWGIGDWSRTLTRRLTVVILAGGTRGPPRRSEASRHQIADGNRSRLRARPNLGPLGLVGAFGRLVVGQRLPRVDVTEGRMRRREFARRLHAEALGEHRGERLHLHLAEARERVQIGVQGVS